MKPNDLFKVNKNYKIVTANENYIIIDDIYDNVVGIDKFLLHFCNPDVNTLTAVNDIASKRFIFKHFLTDIKDVLNKLSMEYFNTEFKIHEENIIKLLRSTKPGVDNRYQKRVHRDEVVTALIHLDDGESGGTAIFDNEYDCTDINLSLHNTYEVKKEDIKYVLEAKKNRLIMFKSDIPHCVYVEDYDKYLDKYRTTQLFFTDNYNYN